MSKKAFRGLIALIIVIVIGFGATIAWGIGSRWGEVKKVKEYFNGWGHGITAEKPDTPDTPDTPDNPNTPDKPDDTYGGNSASAGNGGAIISGIDNNEGISLLSAEIPADEYEAYGIDTLSENAYVLTATITPSTASDQMVEWELKPKSGNVNASDYITLNANGLTATVACKQAFDVQFIVSVRSMADHDAIASCTLDYVERVIDLTLSAPKLTSPKATISYTPQSSKYTVKSELSVSFSGFDICENFEADFCSEYYSACLYNKYVDELVNYTDNGVEFLRDEEIYTELRGIDPVYLEGLTGYFFVVDARAVTEYGAGNIINTFRSIAEECCLGTVDVTVCSYYGGKLYSEVTKSVEIWIDAYSMYVPVSNVGLNYGSLLF